MKSDWEGKEYTLTVDAKELARIYAHMGTCSGAVENFNQSAYVQAQKILDPDGTIRSAFRERIHNTPYYQYREEWENALLKKTKEAEVQELMTNIQAMQARLNELLS
jgi:hypothetical protein